MVCIEHVTMLPDHRDFTFVKPPNLSWLDLASFAVSFDFISFRFVLIGSCFSVPKYSISAVTNRGFLARGKESRGDTSVWTDTPQDKQRKAEIAALQAQQKALYQAVCAYIFSKALK